MNTPAPLLGPEQFGDHGLLARLALLIDDVRNRGLDRLPSEVELGRRLDVQRPRLHRLLLILAREGVLQQIRKKGWFFPHAKLEIPVARHNSYTGNMLEQKKKPRSEVLGIDQIQTAEGWCWVLDFRRYDGELAFSLARVQLDQSLTPSLNRHLAKDVSLYKILEREYGIRPDRRHTWCEAVAADPVLADALGLAVGSPLLKTTHEAHWLGKPFETSVNYLRADSCRVRFDLTTGEEQIL